MKCLEQHSVFEIRPLCLYLFLGALAYEHSDAAVMQQSKAEQYLLHTCKASLDVPSGRFYAFLHFLCSSKLLASAACGPSYKQTLLFQDNND